jgi:8-oxo-dGTP pyrophosphatase MutT (NUDIX family)
MSDSHIQRRIISRLKNAANLRYSQLLPGDISRDLFNYHLRQLVEKGVITKLDNSRGYTLSAKGQSRVADVLHTSDQADRLFKVNVLLIVLDIRPDGLYVLNQRRTSQPDYGTIGIPGGTIVKAEPLLDGAARKLTQETGLQAVFSYIAATRRILYKNDMLFADVIFPICFASEWSGTLTDTEFGENFWTPIAQAIAHEEYRIEMIPTILRAIQNDTLDDVRGQYHEQIVR